MLVCACVFVLARLCAPCTCTEKQEINWGKRKSDTPYAESDCAFYSNAVWQRAHLLHKRLWRKVHFSRTVEVPAHEIVLGSEREEKSLEKWFEVFMVNALPHQYWSIGIWKTIFITAFGRSTVYTMNISNAASKTHTNAHMPCQNSSAVWGLE